MKNAVISIVVLLTLLLLSSVNAKDSLVAKESNLTTVIQLDSIPTIYQAPAVPELPTPKADSKDNDGKQNFRGYLDSVASYIHYSAIKNIAESIKKIDPKVYNTRLAMVKAFSELDSSDQYQKDFQTILEIIEEQKLTQSVEMQKQIEKKQYQALRALNRKVLGKSPEFYQQITAPTMTMDEKGIVRSGFIPNPIDDKNYVILQIKKTSKKALILKPQALTAWPGDENSITQVIDPKDGPWKVIAGVSQRKVIGRQLALFEPGRTLKSTDFIKFKLNDYILLQSKTSDEAIGWLSLDEAATEVKKVSGWGFYRDGYAAALQGWYKFEDRTENRCIEFFKSGEPGECEFQCMPGELYYYNFAHLVRINYKPSHAYFLYTEGKPIEVEPGESPYYENEIYGSRISKIWFKNDYLYENLLMKISDHEYTFETTGDNSIEFSHPWRPESSAKKYTDAKLLEHFKLKSLGELLHIEQQ